MLPTTFSEIDPLFQIMHSIDGEKTIIKHRQIQAQASNTTSDMAGRKQATGPGTAD